MNNIWLTLLSLCLALHFTLAAEVFCPICQNSHNEFLASNNKIKRDNACCPTCRSLERHRHLWLFLKENKPDFFNQKATLLHWAPEICFIPQLKSLSHLTYIQADINRPYNPDITKLDITNIALPDSSVEVTICSHVLEHIVDDHKAMTELYRVLKPGGYALIMVPLYCNLEKTYEDFSITTPNERLMHFDQSDHVRKYAMDIVDRLEKVGFHVEAFPLKRLSHDLREKYGLSGSDEDIQLNATRGADIFLCSKPYGSKQLFILMPNLK